MYFSASERVQSQPTWPIAPTQSQVAAPASQSALRADQVQLLMGALMEAETHGFAVNAFGQAEIAQLLKSADPAERARGEARLQRAVVAYARAQRGQRITDFPSEWAVRPAAYNADQDFAFALSQDRLKPWIASLAPPFERYRALQTALMQYKDIQARGGWPTIPAGAALKPGVSDPRVVALRQRIAAENAPGALDVTSPVYDQALASIVQRVQGRYGLPDDGVVGATTIAALNKPVEARIQQIAANMERWRWMPRAWPRTRIEVNIPGAELDVFDDNARIETMKVAVGKSTNRTPMLMSEIHSVVLNPPWNVPTSIASKELIPKGAGYLARNGFRWVSNGAGGSRLQQQPGPGNSLGRVKFDFNNPFGVYLHDTSAKGVFDRDARSVSHGCVRVERPEELAAVLMQGTPGWDASKVDAVLQDTDTVRAQLGKRWPVIIAYWTVFAGPDGQVNFRDDVYGWDQQLTRLLGGGGLSA